MNQRSNFIYTVLEVVCTLLVIFGLGQFFNSVSRWQFGLMNDWSAIALYCGSVIVISIVVAILWHRKDPDRINPAHRWLETFIAFYLVYMICGYAFAKILKTQFQAPNYVLDTPIGELGGFWLTWTYFGFSETFAYILGWTQIVGSIFLLFRKTRLLGTFILIPVMINICLIDHFYSISPLAYYNALHYTFMLFFILSLDASKLIPVFFAFEDTLKYSNWKFWTLNAIRVLIVVFAFVKIYSLRESFQPKTKINGVWRVNKLNMAGREHHPDSVWSKIYFEWRYGCVLKFDRGNFKKMEDQHGDYSLNEENSQLRINLPPALGEQKGDSLLLHYYYASDSALQLAGLYNKDSIKMDLIKLK